MNKNEYEKEMLLAELKKLEDSVKNSNISINKIKEIMAILTEETKQLTKEEFDTALLEVAKMISRSDNYKTIMGNKRKLEKGERRPDEELRPEIQAKFGIPVSAWADIPWYYASLKPHKRKKS